MLNFSSESLQTAKIAILSELQFHELLSFNCCLDSMTIFQIFLEPEEWKSFCKMKILHIIAESKGNS